LINIVLIVELYLPPLFVFFCDSKLIKKQNKKMKEKTHITGWPVGSIQKLKIMRWAFKLFICPQLLKLQQVIGSGSFFKFIIKHKNRSWKCLLKGTDTFRSTSY